MLVFKKMGSYYTQDMKPCTTVDSLQSYLQDQTITITDSLGLSRYDNVIDTRILFWLGNNFYKPENINLSKVTKQDYKKLFDDLKVKLRSHAQYVDQAKALTKLYLMINENHTLEINQGFYHVLHEYYMLNEDTKKKFAGYQYEGIENLDDLTRGIQYDFINPVGKIWNRGFSLTKFDRKKYIELFKPKKDHRYYLLDFISFEPSCLNFYIPNYVNEGFYLKNAERFAISRDEFKGKFIAYLNGAGEKILGDLLGKFRGGFPEIEELRKSMKSSRIQNCFGTTLSVDSDYKKMTFLIQSTGADVIKKVHTKLFHNMKGCRLIWSLFDEFLVEVEPDYKIEEIKQFFELYPFIKIKITEV